jgi:hypothetical protein
MVLHLVPMIESETGELPMTRVHVTGGYLNVEGAGAEGPVDPGFGGGIGAGHPDNSLPPGIPPIGVTLPEPPPGIWPPPSWSRPIVPVGPDNTLPVAPGTIWPTPGRPARPDNSLPGGSGGQIDNSLPSQTFWVVCGIPGVGWRYIAVDPSLSAGMPLPPAPAPKG